MVTNHVMVSFGEGAQSALDGLAGRADKAQSELTHEALVLCTANFEATMTDVEPNLEAYHQVLPSGEHVLLDTNLLYTFLDYVEGNDGEPVPESLDAIDRVTAFHVHEYCDQFRSLAKFLDWLSFCGFPTIRISEGGTSYVVFPTESVKWFMSRFIVLSTEQSSFDVEVGEDISRVPFTEVR